MFEVLLFLKGDKSTGTEELVIKIGRLEDEKRELKTKLNDLEVSSASNEIPPPS